MTPTVTKNHALVGTTQILVQIWEPGTHECGTLTNTEHVVDWKIFDEDQSIETAMVWGQLKATEAYQWIKLTVQEWREQCYESSWTGPMLDAEIVDIKAKEGYSDGSGDFTWYETPVSEL